MKTLIFGDVHGNLPAFELMLKHAGTVDKYISLGDIVNYLPWSNECVDLLISLKNCVKLIGNHDECFISGTYSGENQLVKCFFDFCIPHFARRHDLEKFENQHVFLDVTYTHTLEDRYIYPDTSLDLDGNYVIGHSHHQFRRESNTFFLINAGSVGQNRKFINVIDYLIHDSSTNTYEMRHFVYDIEIITSTMKALHYPGECIDYYASKARA